jgi:hypothetical protein
MLRNLLEGAAEEGTLRRTLAAVNLARTAADQLRVNVDSGTVTTLTQMQWGANGNGQPAYYGTGAPNSIDMREVARYAARANFQQRAARWSWV